MRSAFCSILFVCLGLVIANGRGESTATSDIFLNAYLACGSAEKLEATGDTAGAIESYKRAITLLDQVTREDPAWKPDMVKRRRDDEWSHRPARAGWKIGDPASERCVAKRSGRAGIARTG